jgi:hypothetical protein
MFKQIPHWWSLSDISENLFSVLQVKMKHKIHKINIMRVWNKHLFIKHRSSPILLEGNTKHCVYSCKVCKENALRNSLNIQEKAISLHNTILFSVSLSFSHILIEGVPLLKICIKFSVHHNNSLCEKVHCFTYVLAYVCRDICTALWGTVVYCTCIVTLCYNWTYNFSRGVFPQNLQCY